jgi:Flp pilus assembly protein TadG
MSLLRNLATNRRGSIAILAAVGMTVLIGMSGLVIDLGAAYAQQAKLQNVADRAALAGAISWLKTGSGTAAQATVQDIVVANGWPASIIQTTTSPTTSVPNVTVSLAAPSTLTLGGVLTSSTSITSKAYSVAGVVTTTTPACLLALTTLMVNGYLNINGCAAVSDALLTINSGASLIASVINTTLATVIINGTASPTPKTGVSATADPYSGTLTAALAGFLTGCSYYTNQSLLSPGCWLNVNVNSALTLAAGTYFFPTLSINSGGSITGTGGVTVVTGEQSIFNASGSITLTAPSTGTFAGIAIDALGGMTMNSGVTFNVNGAIYAPFGTVILNSGTWNKSACTYLVALAIIANSSSTLTLPQTRCNTYGYLTAVTTGGAKVALLQ